MKIEDIFVARNIFDAQKYENKKKSDYIGRILGTKTRNSVSQVIGAE